MELLKGLAIWLAAFGLATVILLSICPRILTGSYADITIDYVTVDKDGHYNVDYSMLVATHTTVITRLWAGPKYLGGGISSHGAYFGWPTHESTGIDFTLDPEAIAGKEPLGPRSKRLLVSQGETQRIHAGEKFYFYYFKTSDGALYSGYIEVENY